MKDKDTVTITLTKQQYEWVINTATCEHDKWCAIEDDKRRERWEPYANLAFQVMTIKSKEEGQ